MIFIEILIKRCFSMTENMPETKILAFLLFWKSCNLAQNRSDSRPETFPLIQANVVLCGKMSLRANVSPGKYPSSDKCPPGQMFSGKMSLFQPLWNRRLANLPCTQHIIINHTFRAYTAQETL
jgi:hypothetical protein